MVETIKDYFPEKPWACKCGCGFDSINPKLVEKLNRARHEANTAFVIVSACRCKTYNDKIGGVKNSAHTRGNAVDIRCRYSHKRHKTLRGLRKEKFQRVGIAKSFIHADIDEELPPAVTFLY